MNSSATFNEADVVRDRAGQFAHKAQSAPELTLGEPAPIIINVPATGDRRANLWISVPRGQLVEMNVFEAGIGRPEEETWREDTITFRRTDEGVRAVYEVTDDDISMQFEQAFAELSEEEGQEMMIALRNEVQVQSYGNADVFWNDGNMEFRHVSDHELDDDGGFFTANVFGQLESDRSYVATRDGVLFLSAYKVLRDNGFDD